MLSLPEGAEEVDAFSLWEDGLPYIFLSTMKTAERSRFDLAHELGHLILHAGLDASANSERNAEKEADQFASELLMPRFVLRSSVGREPSIGSLLGLKEHLGVSAMALAYAFHKAGIYTDWSYRQMCIELTRRGYRSGEPEGMRQETSKVFGFVFPALRKSKGLSLEDVAHGIGVSTSELHGLTFGQALSAVNTTAAEQKPQRSSAHLSLVR
ncbi:ImmA/IrrE family metallo-endopeptidase [Paenarthrobacter sp. GOM3]|uniref:ImmA/IrrE family metallo-endopeptidase n=1 Tax=Paenarthrobacter sp. GOM3 TaxID=2782567 RepID=UPI001BA8CA5E|nr:ImmA/IrrE family metallo-endopeptidase [Paenarthrobacter sp. GOM3]WOH18076.1 ImmA/IrrE family metallo-endopeptidase [Paenarthrobacter sp. GOM3]